MLKQCATGSATASCSTINAGEVYYQLARRAGQKVADAWWRDAASARFPVQLFSSTDARVRRAALLKAVLPIAYADAFAMALALELRQPLMTGDPEIREVARQAGVTLEWLPEGRKR